MDLPFKTVTDGPAETEALGASLAGLLKAGDCVMIEGDLGAGKTVFVRGTLRALGVTGPVTSPTFTLAKRYDDARIPASHIDLYRLADGMPGEDPGVLEGEFAPDRVVFIEWPERLGPVSPSGTHYVQIEHLSENTRKITVS